MSRHYHLYSLSDQARADKIVGEITKMDGVLSARITDDLKELDIDMDAGRSSAIMDRVVNICRKVSYGCEVRYKFG